MSKEYNVKVEFENGDVYADTLSAWLWEEVILKDIGNSDKVVSYAVEIVREKEA